MTQQQMQDILSKYLGESGGRGDQVRSVPADIDLTFLGAMEGETLTVARVVQVEIAGGLLIADTIQGERVVLPCEAVRAARFRGPGVTKRGAGFGD